MTPPPLNVGFGTPFEAQIEFMRKKLRLPTERWDDIQRSAHDRAFIVAGAAKADLLADLHQAVLANGEQGLGVREFQKSFKGIVAKHGWTGWTGEGTAEGEAWRARIIYQTNMATSYAAGRRRQMTDPEYLRLRPYWRYIHSDGVAHPRPHHLAWHGLTLAHDHPFWQTHFAPNGWGCQCRLTTVSRKEGEASARAGLGDPPDGWDAIDPKTGGPVGIDKGFDYAPGANVDMPLRQMVQSKLISYPAAIAKALSADVGRYINAKEAATSFAARTLTDASMNESLWLGFVENHEAVTAVANENVKGYLVTVPSNTPRHVEASHGKDGNGQRAALPGDYENVLDVLTLPDKLTAGKPNRHSGATVVATKQIGQEIYRAVFEVLTGKKNRALSLLSLVIKTEK